MSKDLVDLNDQEKTFIYNLLENGGNLRKAARDAGFCQDYAYTLRQRLSKAIVEATQEYFGLHALVAANRVVQSITDDAPNPVNLNAAFGLLDRVGISKKDLEIQATVVKANIFILPAKNNEVIIEHED